MWRGSIVVMCTVALAAGACAKRARYVPQIVSERTTIAKPREGADPAEAMREAARTLRRKARAARPGRAAAAPPERAVGTTGYAEPPAQGAQRAAPPDPPGRDPGAAAREALSPSGAPAQREPSRGAVRLAAITLAAIAAAAAVGWALLRRHQRLRV